MSASTANCAHFKILILTRFDKGHMQTTSCVLRSKAATREPREQRQQSQRPCRIHFSCGRFFMICAFIRIPKSNSTVFANGNREPSYGFSRLFESSYLMSKCRNHYYVRRRSSEGSKKSTKKTAPTANSLAMYVSLLEKEIFADICLLLCACNYPDGRSYTNTRAHTRTYTVAMTVRAMTTLIAQRTQRIHESHAFSGRRWVSTQINKLVSASVEINLNGGGGGGNASFILLFRAFTIHASLCVYLFIYFAHCIGYFIANDGTGPLSVFHSFNWTFFFVSVFDINARYSRNCDDKYFTNK